MAQAKTTAITKKIDDMLDSWEEYARDTRIVCYQCNIGNHFNCRNVVVADICDCVCDVGEDVTVLR